ncbi:MAG: tetratricopeptide repeat protein, partial [Candidatus Omnitrophota bacterium]
MRNVQELITRALSQRQGLFILGLAFALTVIIYGPVMPGEFVWDDQGHFESNLLIRRLTFPRMGEIFSSTVYDIYIPLTVFSFALEYHFFHGAPLVSHLNNLFLHGGVMFLVYCLALQAGVTERAAGMAALVFGVHPMHVEAVAWISARKDVLSTFFYLLALLQYMTYCRTRARVQYLLTLFFGLLSMLAKPMAASLPVVLFVCDGFAGRRLTRQSLLEKLPLILMLFPLAWLTLSGNLGDGTAPPFSAPILTWVWTFMFYLRKFFIPFNLCPLYNWPGPVSWAQEAYRNALLAGMALGGSVYLLRKKRWFYFPVMFYVAAIFLVLRTSPHGAGLTPVADRYMYLPSLGFCLALGAAYEGLSRVAERKGRGYSLGLQAVTGVIVCVMAVSSFQQALIWKDGYSLWGYVLNRDPRNPTAHCNLGLTFLRDGDKGEAKKHFLAAARFHSADAQNYNNLGNLLYEEGRPQEAKRYFETAFRLNPGYAQAYSNYGVVLMEEGEYARAQKFLVYAAALAPGQPDILKNLGNVYLVQNKDVLAEHAYLQALALDPAHLYV